MPRERSGVRSTPDAQPMTGSASSHPDGSYCDVSGRNRAPTSTATLRSKTRRPTAKLGYDVDGEPTAKASRVNDGFTGQVCATEVRHHIARERSHEHGVGIRPPGITDAGLGRMGFGCAAGANTGDWLCVRRAKWRPPD